MSLQRRAWLPAIIVLGLLMLTLPACTLYSGDRLQ
jgi:hypothetical protein